VALTDAEREFLALFTPVRKPSRRGSIWADRANLAPTQHRKVDDCCVGRIGGRGARSNPHPHRRGPQSGAESVGNAWADPQNSLTRSKPRPDGDGRAVLRLPNSRAATMSARARFRDCDDEASPHQHLAEQIRAMTVDREALEKFFAINRARFDRCLEPQMSCQKKAIRAHSIQNTKR
jgi:hypothetical protein